MALHLIKKGIQRILVKVSSLGCYELKYFNSLIMSSYYNRQTAGLTLLGTVADKIFATQYLFLFHQSICVMINW